MSFVDYLKGPGHRANADRLQAELASLQNQYSALEKLARECGVLELQAIRNHIVQEETNLLRVQSRIIETEDLLQVLRTQLESVRGEILVMEDTVLLESFALYVPKFKLPNSADYKIRLDAVRARQKDLIKSGGAATGNMNWEVNGKKSEGKKRVNDMIKLLIRSFNNECDYCVDNVKFDNIESGESRIKKSFETCNKLGRVMTVSLSNEFLELKLNELHLAHEFQLKKQEEKEQAKKLREELREQQKLEQEIRAAREKIAKERKHFGAAITTLQSRLSTAIDTQERADLEARISEVQAQRNELDTEEKIIDYREQNAKAGYVYVISNVGAFGEGVFKIGMTRRLDPMERVDELGDASVPFWFDVYAMVFSENAPALEAKLHERFAQGRLNKVNGRKEFFRADIKEIEAIIRANYDALVEVVHDAPAEQYRESLRLTMPAQAIQVAEHAAIQEVA
jgi:Domain of unknown function (DUF4041)/T5orf172 domain